MNIKVNGEYLDFNGEIEVEKRIKLFEDVSSTEGDVSFSFEIPNNPENLRKLSIPLPDVYQKQIYAGLPCELVNFGNVVYRGSLRVERVSRFISASFFSGNSNWFSQITGTLLDLDFSEYDENLTATNISNSWSETEGMKYPLIDSGILETRGSVLIPEDFVPFLFVKTVFKNLFNSSGIKVRGELFEDPIFNKILITGNRSTNATIQDRSTYARKTSTQTTSSPVKLTFPDDSTEPYYDGSANNFDDSRYTADVRMYLDVDLTMLVDASVSIGIIRIKVNGSDYASYSNLVSNPETWTITEKNIKLNAGDYIEIEGDSSLTPTDFLVGSAVKFTPVYVYRTYGNAILPNWTKQDFVSNILRMFNVISSYDEFSQTVTFNLFEKIKEQTPVDISEYVRFDEVNYEQFVGNYAQRNLLTYDQPDIDQIKTYNKQNAYEYGTGTVDIENNFLEPEDEMIELEFSAPYGYFNRALAAHVEKLTINETESLQTFSVTQVNDDSGVAEIVLPSGHGITQGDLIEIRDSSISAYNGSYIVEAVTSTTIECYGLDYVADADLTLERQRVVRADEDDAYILLDSSEIGVEEFSSLSEVVIQTGVTTNTYTEAAFGYFNFIDNGFSITDFLQTGLFFGRPTVSGSYQRSLTDEYWGLFTMIANDPVILPVIAYLPLHIFMSIDFLSPVTIRMKETSNEYYVNKISGYKSKDQPCQLELIKL